MSRDLLEAQVDGRAERIVFSDKEIGTASAELLDYIQFLLEIHHTRLTDIFFQGPNGRGRDQAGVQQFIQSVRENPTADLRLGVLANVSRPEDIMQQSVINTLFTDQSGRLKAIGYQVLPPRIDQWLRYRARQVLSSRSERD